MVYQILSYLPARDLKTARLVNRLLSGIGKKNIFWSELCRQKWSEKLCLETLPVPSPHVPDTEDSDDDRGSVVSASSWRDEQRQIVAAYAARVIPKPYVRVSDNGRGVDPAVESTLFEPFVSAKSEGNRKLHSLASTIDCLRPTGLTACRVIKRGRSG